MAEDERRLAAIMFTDIVGYAALTQRDEKLALSLLERHRQLIRPIISRHGGREIKTMGDAFLIEFTSTLDAIEAATDMQKVLHEHNRAPSDKFLVRIGLHVGDVVHRGQDVLGDAVNIASRIEPVAEPGGICVSEQVYAQVRNKIPYRMERLAAHSLKNVQYPVEMYRVVLPSDEEGAELSGPKNRVAILPLSNISPDPKDGYFADGMTEELITVLSQVQGLRVIARTSVDRYRNKDRGVAQIGRELGVGSLLEGSVRIAGERLRVTVQLVDASNEEHLWSENYDRKLDDIFAVQTDIAKRVAEKLEVKLMSKDQSRMVNRGVPNLSAYKTYLKGRALLAKRNPSEMNEAKQLFERAISEDPTFAPALAGLADAYYLLGDYWGMPVDEGRRKSKEFVSRALKLDPDLAEAHATLGLHLFQEYEFARAESEFKRAIELNPSYPNARMWYAQVLAVFHRYDEQQEQLEIAEQLDPLSPIIQWNLGTMFALFGRKEAALENVKKLYELKPGSIQGVSLESFCYYLGGEPKRALSVVEQHRELHNEIPIIGALGICSAAAGDMEAARAWLKKLLDLPDTSAFKALFIAFVHLELRDYDQFFAWANKGVDKKEIGFEMLGLYPVMKPILEDPRWKSLLKRVNLDAA